MTREALPPRREGITMDLLHTVADCNQIAITATYSWDASRTVREVFCLSRKSGTDLQSLLHQACIAISLGLQHGATMAELCHTLGEDGDETVPRSIIGLIVRAGATLDCERLSADIHPFPNSPAVAQSEARASVFATEERGTVEAGEPIDGVEVAGSNPAGAAIITSAEIEQAVSEAVCSQCGHPESACDCIPAFLRRSIEPKAEAAPQ